MQETSEIKDITKKLKRGDFSLIGIDGIDGSGKSTLAKRLSTELSYVHIELDNYIEKYRGRFVQHIKHDEVREKIKKAQSSVIVEGICLFKVFEKLKMSPDLSIYIKKMSDDGLWQDESKCNVQGDIDKFMTEMKKAFGKFVDVDAGIEGGLLESGKTSFSELVEEIIRYHYEHKPHLKADLIYRRTGMATNYNAG
jgi:uridine kinase